MKKLVLVLSILTMLTFGVIAKETMEIPSETTELQISVVDSQSTDSTSTVLNNNGFQMVDIAAIIITVVMSILALIFGSKYYKKKELAELILKTISNSIEDNKISPEQLKTLIQLFKQKK